MSREEYIKYFTHMQDEDQKCILGGMDWDDIGWLFMEPLMRIKCLQEQNLVLCFQNF